MRKVIKWILLLVVLALVALWWLGKTPRSVSAEVDINATPDQVWAVLQDVDSWADWNTKITRSEGQAAMDASLTIQMIGPDSPDGPTYNPVMTVFDQPNTFRWRAVLGAGFVFTNDKLYTLTATETGTRVTHTEVFCGMMLPLMWGMLDSGVGPIIEAMNADLKAKVEG